MAKRKPEQPVEREQPEIPGELLDIPRRLRGAMEDEDINATQLSEVAGVSTQVITRILRGERLKGMRASSAVRIARALGLRLDWLLAGIEPRYRAGGAVTDGTDAEAIVRATLASLGYQPPDSERPSDEPRSATENSK